MYKTFKNYLMEQEIDISQIPAQSPRTKELCAILINDFLTWIQNPTNQQTSFEDIQARIKNFQRDLGDYNDRLKNIISNENVKTEYEKKYNQLNNKLNELVDPPANINKLIQEIISLVSDLHTFIQSKIR